MSFDDIFPTIGGFAIVFFEGRINHTQLVLRSDSLKAAFKEDLNSHLTALEAIQYKLNEKILRSETEPDTINPIIQEATITVEKFITASKHVKKFVPSLN